MPDNQIYATVRYRGRLMGSVMITRDTDTTGYAAIDGRSRKVVYRLATKGKYTGKMLWHCDDND